jgi:hypothetical protein
MQQTVPSTNSTPQASTEVDLRKVIIKPLQRRHNDVYMRGLRRPRA